MLVTLGFLLAALLLVVFLPAYRRRIERFTTEALKQTLPLTEDEIRADKDRLRADFAMQVHKLEARLEESSLAAARQSVEINRRDAKIQEFSDAIAAHKMTVEEHENARRVLEQAILDRLPKVEQRLADTRKLLAARDREIAQLTETRTKQAAALEEAQQLNKQQAEDLYRARAALETRAARNRDAVGDLRFEGEVALRTEIEMLRAKTRDQAALIDRLQSAAAEPGTGTEADRNSEAKIEQLTAELAKAETKLVSMHNKEGSREASLATQQSRIKELEAAEQDSAAEIAKLRAALKAYENGAASAPGDSMTAKAEISALEAEVEEQQKTIQSLRAEIAANNEQIARQAQHFSDEIRRLGAPPDLDELPASVERPKLSLAERIVAPKVPRRATIKGESVKDDAAAPPDDRPRDTRAGFLKALNGGSEDHVDGNKREPANPSPDQDAKPPRRARLLERISGLDKQQG
jgi:chromosome segregation ATPase